MSENEQVRIGEANSADSVKEPHLMTLEAAIGARRSIRRYESVPIPRAQIEHMIDMAKMSPSPKNRQAWLVRVLEGASKDGFVEMGYACLQRLKEAGQRFGSLEISLHAMKTAGAVLIIYNPFDDDIDYERIWQKVLTGLGSVYQYNSLNGDRIRFRFFVD